MAETVRGVSALQNELEKAKESLKDVDENIKKLTGRDPTMQRQIKNPQRRVSLGSADRGGRTTGGAEGRLFNLARRGIIQEETSPVKRRMPQGGAFARLGPPPPRRDRRGGRDRDSGEEDDLPYKPAVQSSVTATSREERSRQNSIEEQSKDRKGQARNRRMFGLLLGTLQKFKDDAAVSKEKEEQRQKIEKKLEEKFKQEKEDIIKERRQLFLERRQKQFRIRLLEQKMEMAQNHEDWERETRKLENFIITKAKPCLFYLPKVSTGDTEAKLAETREAITGMIEMRRKKLEEEIAEMMNQVPDDGMEEGEEQGASGEEMDGESDDEERMDKHIEDKENDDEQERLRVKKDTDEQDNDSEKELEDEREKRDKERIERDRDRQVRDRSGEGRKYRERSGDRSKEGREKERERDTSDGRKERERDTSDGRKDRERDRHREKGHRRGHSRSRSRDRDRHRSGKSRSDRKREHSDDEKSRGHGSKSKRRSRSEGKAEKREKVWEPMEDEVEEEFVGSREGEKASIASKMLEMAGMTEAVKAAKADADEASVEAPDDTDTPTAAGELGLEDIPRPPATASMQEQDLDNADNTAGDPDDNRDQLEPDHP